MLISYVKLDHIISFYCRFKSVSDYGSMVRDLREGRLRDVKVKSQTYRAVSLERKQNN